MIEICTDLSACGYAILAAIVHAETQPPTIDELFVATRPRNIHEIADWPETFVEWVDEVQILIDRGLVMRAQSRQGFRYAISVHGFTVFKAAMHPRAPEMGSVS